MKRYVSNILLDSLNASSSRTCAPISRSTSLVCRAYSTQGESPIKDDNSKIRKFGRHRDDNQRSDRSASTLPSSKHLKSPGGRDQAAEDDTAIAPRRVYNLKYTDPLRLANDTLAKLKKDKFEEALEIVRKSSASLDCTVSWNHLIDWQCKKGKVNSAIKTYNELKKRGQTPDAYTYTLIFRGLAQQAHQHPSAVAHALSIYHSMDADNAPVTPNVIHTNAVLKVCAQAGDMDAMFGIAAKLKDKGLRAPNNLTFTIIFNAIRENAIKRVSKHMTAEELQPLRTKSVTDARRMWQDIVNRWRHGDLWIDEELVCSMGRILLMGDDRDKNDVLAMLRQAMKIPQLVMRNERQPRPIAVPKADENLEEWEGQTTEAKFKAEGGDVPAESPIPHDQFKRIVPAKRKDTYGKGLSSFPTPGQNTLSLLMETLQEAKFALPATLYWKIFTEHYGVKPDSANIHSYLRILRQGRLSDETTAVLQQMPTYMLEKKTFRIAIASCARDKQNPNAFANASRIVDLMQKTMDQIDLPTLHIFLDVALDADTDPKRFQQSPKRQPSPETIERMKQALSEADLSSLHSYLDRQILPSPPPSTASIASPAIQREEKHVKGQQILHALSRTKPSILNIKATLAYSVPNAKRSLSPEGAKDSLTVNAAYQQDALKLAQRMISAYDQLMNKGMAPRDQFRLLHQERAKLAAMVTRYKDKYQPDNWHKFKASSFKTWNKERPEASALEETVEPVDEEKAKADANALW
jgi:pentatricopeptide repeat protein